MNRQALVDLLSACGLYIIAYGVAVVISLALLAVAAVVIVEALRFAGVAI